MSCPEDPCALEQSAQSKNSPGPVGPDELICRGAFDPRHGNAKTKHIRTALFEKVPLSKGEQSAYRAGRAVNWHLEDVRDQLLMKPPEGQTLFQVIGVSAERIRKLTPGPKLRVVDETVCDTDGNHHPKHVHISPCRQDQNYPLGDSSAQWVQELAENLATMYRHPDQVLNVSA